MPVQKSHIINNKPVPVDERPRRQSADEIAKQAEERLNREFASFEKLINDFTDSLRDKPIAELQRLLDDAEFLQDALLTFPPYVALCK